MKIISTAVSLMHLLNNAFDYVIDNSIVYNIDESHALKHSMEVYNFAKKNFENEVIKNPYLEDHKRIIYMAAIGHDMCDKKYMDEKEGIARFQLHLSNFMEPNELEAMGNIIETMSYSKVKLNGYPNLGKYQLAYHIVREADLLSAYDIDRCIMYAMYRNNKKYSEALIEALDLFDNRVLKMRQDNLFETGFSKKESIKLQLKALKDVETLKNNLLIK
jgi:hypothetical protein